MEAAHKWFEGKDFVECHRYHAKLSRKACVGYRRLNPMACKGCPSAGLKPSNRAPMIEDPLDWMELEDIEKSHVEAGRRLVRE